MIIKIEREDEYVKAHMFLEPEIMEMTEAHWTQVREIYRAGINGGNATFENNVPTWEDWDRAHHPFARLVATDGSDVVGWACLTPVSARKAYAGVAEVSVYISATHQGRGFGRALLQRLIEESENAGIWTLQAGIFPENVASLSLHSSCGFREVGYRERIGKLNGAWRNTVLMERRSKRVGNE